MHLAKIVSQPQEMPGTGKMLADCAISSLHKSESKSSHEENIQDNGLTAQNKIHVSGNHDHPDKKASENHYPPG